MLKKFVAIAVVLGGLVSDIEAAPAAPMPAPSKTVPVAWRGGYRYRRYSYPAYSGNAYRGSGGRTSALDYPSYSQPTISRNHQWNKYPNQPFYLRGERRSLGILP
jgi:hypothetical protein